ncbi:MAG: hypothetical protein OXN90_10065 [Gemmatimonadota bacterium]|nr:hypothetical protein [Gemmatimonadota bacterium]
MKRTLIPFMALFLASCTNKEQEMLLLQLQSDMVRANAAIDSLTYSLDDSNRLLDDMRAQVDSTQQVNDKLLENVQKLNKELRHWSKLATEYKQSNARLKLEIEQLRREKQTDRYTISQLRAETDRLNGELLETHSSIRRQSDHIRRLEQELAQTKAELDEAKKAAQNAVFLYAANETQLVEQGYLKTHRPFGRGFRKQYELIKKIDRDSPGTQVAPIGQTIALPGEVEALVDHYGKLRVGDDYEMTRGEAGVQVAFLNELAGGTSVLAILKE